MGFASMERAANSGTELIARMKMTSGAKVKVKIRGEVTVKRTNGEVSVKRTNGELTVKRTIGEAMSMKKISSKHSRCCVMMRSAVVQR